MRVPSLLILTLAALNVNFSLLRAQEMDIAITRAAAELGDPIAQDIYGFTLAQNNPSAAFSWVHKAARQGYAPAEARLGAYFTDGIGTPIDLSLARTWFARAAEQGEPFGQFNLAMSLAFAPRLESDRQKAMSWITKAAKQGYETAALVLNAMEFQPWDPDEAKKACADEADLFAIGPGQRVAIVFVNDSDEVRRLYRLDGDGVRQHVADLRPEVFLSETFFALDPWVVTDSTGQCRAIYSGAGIAHLR